MEGLPRVVSMRMLRKYRTQAFPDDILATIPEIRTLPLWTNICPVTCLDTSKNLQQKISRVFENVKRSGAYSDAPYSPRSFR